MAEGENVDSGIPQAETGISIEAPKVIPKSNQPFQSVARPDDLFADIGFANDGNSDPELDRKIAEIHRNLLIENPDINPFVVEYFKDLRLFNSFPSEIRDNPQALGEYILNTSKFSNIIAGARARRHSGDITGLLGEEVSLPESAHADGRVRRAESGYRINVDRLVESGIDPAKVLFFRVTQPIGEKPRPEYYWTSDFNEVSHGLTAEIPTDQRAKAIVLVDSLDKINKNGGLIQDINDDSGISVRQIGTGPYDQNGVIAKFNAY